MIFPSVFVLLYLLSVFAYNLPIAYFVVPRLSSPFAISLLMFFDIILSVLFLFVSYGVVYGV